MTEFIVIDVILCLQWSMGVSPFQCVWCEWNILSCSHISTKESDRDQWWDICVCGPRRDGTRHKQQPVGFNTFI